MATCDHAGPAWDALADAIGAAIAARAVHPARTVVLLPFAQLMPIARQAWARASARRGAGSAFSPRFETTVNWSRSAGRFAPAGDDLRMDAARDVLTAASLMARSGLRRQHADLALALMEAAWSLGRIAAAQPPALRMDWGARMASAMDALAWHDALELEAWLGRIAVAWTAGSAYATDTLFAAQPDLLVVVEGFQPEPLPAALAVLWTERSIVLRLPAASGFGAGTPRLFGALDAEDEAQRAAACVLAHLNQGRAPVALVAQDRLLTRRVRSLLAGRGVAVRDETGWTLSTTRAAATVMVLLRAAAWSASCDAVLEWAKDAPALDPHAVALFEAALRRSGVSEWLRVSADGPVHQAVQVMRETLRDARPVTQWLASLRAVLQRSGQWDALAADVAGQAVIDALYLHDGRADELADLTQRMGHPAFTAWVGQVLESGSFVPPHPAQPQVLILPLSQLLGRTPAAVVLPGCDEMHLPASPEPSGLWTPAQRMVLALPARAELAHAARAAWSHALQSPWIDILWRRNEAGEPVMPGLWLLELLQRSHAQGPETRAQRVLREQPVRQPMPLAHGLRLQRLSASAYDDLRRCPYRFFALRLLGLQEQDELDTEVDKRDFGNWLHMLLRYFHESLGGAGAPDASDRPRLIDAAAERATADMALSAAEFLPFAATWPRVRSAYLAWLAGHESTGARFEHAEAEMALGLGAVTLVGRIDRIDRQSDGTRLVIDYKTEARAKTGERLRNPTEDTQLAFYAALLPDDAPAAMYLSVVEGEPAKAFVQPEIGALRDQLVESIQHDLRRIGEGQPLPALGAGSACDFCAARGLCRQDFWAAEEWHGGARGDA